MNRKLLPSFAVAALLSLAFSGCGKEAEQLRQAHDALQARTSQLESRLNTAEAQLAQANNDLQRMHGIVAELVARQTAPKKAAAPAKAVAPSKKKGSTPAPAKKTASKKSAKRR